MLLIKTVLEVFRKIFLLIAYANVSTDLIILIIFVQLKREASAASPQDYLTAVSNAISIISLNVVCLSSAVVSSPVKI